MQNGSIQKMLLYLHGKRNLIHRLVKSKPLTAMNKIIQKQQFSEKVFKFEIEAPLIAKSRKAGNFVIIRVDKNSERMPLTIADADTRRGTITV